MNVLLMLLPHLIAVATTVLLLWGFATRSAPALVTGLLGLAVLVMAGLAEV